MIDTKINPEKARSHPTQASHVYSTCWWPCAKYPRSDRGAPLLTGVNQHSQPGSSCAIRREAEQQWLPQKGKDREGKPCIKTTRQNCGSSASHARSPPDRGAPLDAAGHQTRLQ
jgi:hypothetical protein